MADPFAGRITMFRVVTGTLKADSTVHNLTRETPERLGHLALLQGKTQTDVPEIKAGDLGAVAKLKETRDQRHARRQGAAPRSRRSSSRSRCSPTPIEPKSRGDEDKISTRAAAPEEEDPTIRYEPRPADQGTAALRPGPAAHRGDGRQAEAALRRRGQPQAAADPVSRDDHGGDRGARPAQEADRRPRPVRRLQDPHGAAAARQPTSSSWTTSSAARSRSSSCPAVEKGIQEARLRGYLAGYPVVDFRVTLVRRLVPRRRLERAVVQDGRPPGVQGRHDAGAADDPRADHERRGLRAVATSPAT